MFQFSLKQKSCNNCGYKGHSTRECQSPITSYGIILFHINDLNWRQENILSSSNTFITGFEPVFLKLQFLLIQRRDSLSFVDIMRGKYNIYDRDYIKKQISGMTDTEREKILDLDFNDLWDDMWGKDNNEHQYKRDKETSRMKLLNLRNGVAYTYNDTVFTLQELINECTIHWDTPEWGFPKGRLDMYEKEIDCALREMTEETGILAKDVQVFQNIEPINETFFGSNHIHYSHKYYIGYVSKASQSITIDEDNILMKREIGNIGWFSLDEALEKIRPDNVEKREILFTVSSLLRNFCPLLHPSKII